ncbi:MAG: peptidylprolyl isomerase [Bacteroidales bacterium]|nr:peptidylprolyl isomerase [Bacteroidales bacterium]
MRKLIILITAFSCALTVTKGQEEILMTIGNEKVTRSEFERIYHKNNSSVVYENKSPREYLDLFINFKLKVMEAKALGYDTMSTFVKELNGYRDQLAKPYLQDKEQIQQMLEETYRRITTEVNASHIAIKIAAGALPADTLETYNKIMSIRDRLLAGESFEDLAVTYSDDPSVKTNKGNLGWFSAFRMVFPFEDAAYKTPVGQLSMPVRTRYGYHILRTNAFRPAIGEIMLAHIMIRLHPNADSASQQAAKEKIFSCYEQLNNGEPFAEVAQQHSEDQASARNGGKLRWVRSGELPPEIEEKVFAIKDSGQYIEPLKSEYGYHIFQCLGKRPIKSFEELKPELEDRIARDERQKNTDLLFVEKIKKEYGFTTYPENVAELMEKVDSSIYENKWDPALEGELIDPVFTIGDRDYSQLELGNYIKKVRKPSKKESIESICKRQYDDFVKEMIIQYEKDRLETKYPEFRHLMEEYHDGILLFNITDDKVWSKAVKDTAGLQSYYNQHKKNYKWQKRADVSRYSTQDSSLVEKILLHAPQRKTKKWTPKEFNAIVSGQDSIQYIEVLDQKYEKGGDSMVDTMTWKKGTTKIFTDKNKTNVVYINGILKPQLKQLKESRGLVTADYQNELEKQWIEELRKKYPVTIHEEVLSAIK